MSPLTELQHKALCAYAKLVLHAVELGYIVAQGDAYRDPRVFGEIGEAKGYGTAKSCHKSRLAWDLILKDKDGNLLGDEAHQKLHEYWITLGGALSIPGDMNHYSFTYQGMR